MRWAPRIRLRVRGQKVPWLTREVKQLMNERGHVHNLALRTNKELHWSSYKRLRNVMTLKLRKEKQRYFNEQLRETKGDSRGTWKNIKDNYLEIAQRVAALLLVRQMKRKRSVTFLIASLSLVRKI